MRANQWATAGPTWSPFIGSRPLFPGLVEGPTGGFFAADADGVGAADCDVDGVGTTGGVTIAVVGAVDSVVAAVGGGRVAVTESAVVGVVGVGVERVAIQMPPPTSKSGSGRKSAHGVLAFGLAAESETTPMPVLAADWVPASATPGAGCGVTLGSACVRPANSAGVAACAGMLPEIGVTGPYPGGGAGSAEGVTRGNCCELSCEKAC